jgi:hypothetical protein
MVEKTYITLVSFMIYMKLIDFFMRFSSGIREYLLREDIIWIIDFIHNI